MKSIRIIFLCSLTMIAFAANSVLCRMALKGTEITPLEFTSVRLLSGSLILIPFLVWKKNLFEFDLIKSFSKAIPLFLYALFFSLAYIKIGAGVGALILFASVQISMIGISIVMGNRLNKMEWGGFILAFGGLVYLLFPGLTAPPLGSALMMMISGVSWGVYSILGKGVKDPIFATAKNFLYCAPLAIILIFFVDQGVAYSNNGFILAIVSGALTSGLGYVLWYLTLRNLSTTVASIVQLSVPIIAAIGGVLFISEVFSLRLAAATIIIFLGIYLTIQGKKYSSSN